MARRLGTPTLDLVFLNFKTDFTGDPVVGTSPSSAEGVGSIPDQGAQIPHA